MSIKKPQAVLRGRKQSLTKYPSTHPQLHTHLPIKSCCHSNDVTSVVVNGENVGGGALGILGEDLISQHPIGSFRIILVHCCYCHHKGSCRETHNNSKQICQ